MKGIIGVIVGACIVIIVVLGVLEYQKSKEPKSDNIDSINIRLE